MYLGDWITDMTSEWDGSGAAQATQYNPDGTVTTVAVPATPNASGGSAWNINWGDVIKQSLTTWGQVQTAQTQADVAKTVGSRYYVSPVPGQTSPSLYPFNVGAGTGTIFGLPINMVIIGAALIGAVIIMSNKKR